MVHCRRGHPVADTCRLGSYTICNLYRLELSVDEVAAFFRGIQRDLVVPQGANAPETVYPGYPGLVATSDALAQKVWGFPLARKGAKGQPLKPKPVNNARRDKLNSWFWRSSLVQRRCIIPVSAFAEAEGERGGKTRTWFTAPDAPLLTIGGIWRDSEEWGRSYSMVMTDANSTVAPLHDRMPVILRPGDITTWLEGDAADALALCAPYPGPLAVDRTDQPWVARS